MLKDLSLHIYDLAENSINGEASLIQIHVRELLSQNRLIIEIKDNGRGMDAETLKRARSPFSTSRTTRKVGLGIPFIEQACIQAGGSFFIDSAPGAGTQLRAEFVYDHIDRQPLGDVASTISLLVTGHPELDFYYVHQVEKKEFIFDTREIRTMIKEIPLNNREVAIWIAEYLKENVDSLY